MCGIAGGQAPRADVERALDALAHRGPDGRGIVEADGFVLGHVRLAVIDPTPASDQPMVRGDVALVFNGEVFNFTELRDDLRTDGRTFDTVGDVEVLAWALDRWEPPDAMRRVEGMVACAWVSLGVLRVARDRYGEVPLHVGRRSDGGMVFASELRAMPALGAVPSSVRMLDPASILTVDGDKATVAYFEHPDLDPLPATHDDATIEVGRLLEEAVAARRVADVPVACLASGGIDSSAVALLLAPLVPGLRLYTAVHDERSVDLRCSRQVADHLGLELVEVPVPAPTADDLAATVRAIETPSKAQTEIAWACLHLARRLRDDGVKVAFSGEGSDELWASYGMSYHGIKAKGWHRYRADTFLGQHRKNFARCNKVFMAHSVECRLPFLHPPLVRYALRLSQEAVEGADGQEKLVLRRAFADRLPPRVSARAKVAFQTGAGLDRAAASALADPQRFYRAEFAAAYPGIRP